MNHIQVNPTRSFVFTLIQGALFLAFFILSPLNSNLRFGVDGVEVNQADAQKRANKKGRKGKKGKKGKKRRNQRSLANTLDKNMRQPKYGLIGMRLHTNFANLSAARTDDPFIQDPSRSVGLGFGLTVDKAVNRIFGVRGEILYQNKNFSARGKSEFKLGRSVKSADTSIYLDYLEVPLMMVIRLFEGKLIRPYIGAGVYGAFRIWSDAEQTDTGFFNESGRPFGYFDAGLVLSAGSYFVFARDYGFLSAELRYSQGLLNVANTGVEAVKGEEVNNKTPLERQIYNMNNLSLMVAYYF